MSRLIRVIGTHRDGILGHGWSCVDFSKYTGWEIRSIDQALETETTRLSGRGPVSREKNPPSEFAAPKPRY